MVNVFENIDFSNLTIKIVQLEEKDKETVHLLLFLLMQFFSRQDQVSIILIFIIIRFKYKS